MQDYSKYRADVATSARMREHRAKNGILILPVGCFEMHGPKAAMSCDSFIAEAAACILAEEWDGLVLPPIHYTYPGGTAPWPGTVDLAPELGVAYVKGVVTALMQQGFERLVLVNIHYPNRPHLYQVVRSIFRETGKIPISMEIDYGAYNQKCKELFGQPHGEGMMMFASLYLLGRHGQWDPTCTAAERREGPGWSSDGVRNLKRRGVEFGFNFGREEDHVGCYPGMTMDDARRGAELLKDVVLAKAKGLPADYDLLLADMRQLLADKPWDRP